MDYELESLFVIIKLFLRWLYNKDKELVTVNQLQKLHESYGVII
jgi:hypothetical protein